MRRRVEEVSSSRTAHSWGQLVTRTMWGRLRRGGTCRPTAPTSVEMAAWYGVSSWRASTAAPSRRAWAWVANSVRRSAILVLARRLSLFMALRSPAARIDLSTTRSNHSAIGIPGGACPRATRCTTMPSSSIVPISSAGANTSGCHPASSSATQMRSVTRAWSPGSSSVVVHSGTTKARRRAGSVDAVIGRRPYRGPSVATGSPVRSRGGGGCERGHAGEVDPHVDDLTG